MTKGINEPFGFFYFLFFDKHTKYIREAIERATTRAPQSTQGVHEGHQAKRLEKEKSQSLPTPTLNQTNQQNSS